MNECDGLAEQFEAQRGRLQAVAYRLLGSPNEAEDAVQEAWLRLGRTDAGTLDNPAGWLRTVVTRICLDMLRARSARREDLAEQQVLDQISEPVQGSQPEDRALLADSVSRALLVVLDALEPAERVAFVLHDMFAVPFGQIAPILERTPVATKKLASRARHKVRGLLRSRRRSSSATGRPSPHSCRPPGPVTSTRSSRCSHPMWCAAATRRCCHLARPPSSVARGPWRRGPPSLRTGRSSRNWPWSTARWGSSWLRVAGC